MATFPIPHWRLHFLTWLFALMTLFALVKCNLLGLPVNYGYSPGIGPPVDTWLHGFPVGFLHRTYSYPSSPWPVDGSIRCFYIQFLLFDLIVCTALFVGSVYRVESWIRKYRLRLGTHHFLALLSWASSLAALTRDERAPFFMLEPEVIIALALKAVVVIAIGLTWLAFFDVLRKRPTFRRHISIRMKRGAP